MKNDDISQSKGNQLVKHSFTGKKQLNTLVCRFPSCVSRAVMVIVLTEHPVRTI